MRKGSLWELRAFCEVIEKNSFVLAARMLGVSPAGTTRAIQSLESQLGAKLLNRSKKRISVTGAGEIYYQFAKKVLDSRGDAEDQISALQNKPKGWVRFSAPEICSRFFLPERLGALSREHADIRFDVVYTDSLLDPIAERLDFAIRRTYPVATELICNPLWSYRLILCASPAYVSKKGLPMEPQELARHSVIVHSGPRVLHDWHFKSPAGKMRVHVQHTHRVNSDIGMYEMILAGTGLGRLADWVALPAIRSGLLVRACPNYNLESANGIDPQMYVVYPSERLPRKCQMLLDALRRKH